MPTHADTFGMVLLEALSCGMAVITTKQFAAKEIIKDGVNGLFVSSKYLFLDKVLIPTGKYTGQNYNLVDQSLVKDIMLKVQYLIENKEMINKMKINSVKDFRKDGKFSIDVRNRKLKNFYKKVI